VATTRADKLTQAAILAKAFKGELVPTEAELARREGRDYEPAAVLLQRNARAGAIERIPYPPHEHIFGRGCCRWRETHQPVPKYRFDFVKDDWNYRLESEAIGSDG